MNSWIWTKQGETEEGREYNDGSGIRLEEEQRITAALRQGDAEELKEVLEGNFSGNLCKKI